MLKVCQDKVLYLLKSFVSGLVIVEVASRLVFAEVVMSKLVSIVVLSGLVIAEVVSGLVFLKVVVSGLLIAEVHGPRLVYLRLLKSCRDL